MKLSTGGNQWFSTDSCVGFRFLSEVPSSREATHPCLKGPGLKVGNQRSCCLTPMLVALRLRDYCIDTWASRADAFSGRCLIIFPRFRVEPRPTVQVWMLRRWPMHSSAPVAYQKSLIESMRFPFPRARHGPARARRYLLGKESCG